MHIPFVQQSLLLSSVHDCEVDDVRCRSRYRSEASCENGKGHEMK